MSMNQIPTLVMGIGGVGCNIAGVVHDSLSEDDKQYVSIIGVDTNVNDLGTLKEKHKTMVTIQTSDEMVVDSYLKAHPEYKDWFPGNQFLKLRTMTDGAGQIRTLSRLAFLESVEHNKFDVVLQEITRIRRVGKNPNSGTLAVVIVGSITGGTGAGLFLSLPFYIRALVKQQVGINNLVIRGMFVGPDITEDVQPSSENKDAVCVNGYACLKELNAFYMRPVLDTALGSNLHLEYYDNKNTSTGDVPYNYLYLFEKGAKFGTMGLPEIAETINYIGQLLYMLMFSPVTPERVSVEDNFILTSISNAGMNRYSSSGMCRMIYPEQTAQEYVALTTVKNLVKKEWLLIDQEFNSRAKVALARMTTDPTLKKPELKTEYQSIFEEAVTGDHPKLGMLAQEAYTFEGSSPVSRSQRFLRGLDAIIDELINKEFEPKAEACKVSNEKMKNFTSAAGEVDEVWDSLKVLTDYVKLACSTKANGFADRLFPVSAEVMESNKDKDDCIYHYLATVHPVTARFFIYSIIEELEKKIAALRPEIEGVNLLAYKKEDFNPKVPDVQGPSEYIETIRNEKNNPLWDVLGPVGKAISGEEKALRKVGIRLQDVCSSHVKRMRGYLSNSLKCQTAELVLERMIHLADNYTIFFNTVAAKIERNNDNIDRLENIHFTFGQDGIYCSKEAFRNMAMEYSTQHPLELSDKAKKAIFEQIYLIQARAYSLASSTESQAVKTRRERENRRRLESVFERAVVKSVHDAVVKNGAGIVNLNAREALIKEFELIEQKLPDDEDYRTALDAYIKDRMSTAFRIASPMLATDGMVDGAELRFFAVSPACAETNINLEPDVSETSRVYLPNDPVRTTVIINDEFADTEITCIRIQYNYTIENLVKYKTGTRNELAYRARINNLENAQGVSVNSSKNEQLVTINPHLDTNWHQEAFIPEISSSAREQAHIDVLRAFIYGIGFDYFKLLKDDEHPDEKGNPRPTWYDYSNIVQSRPIRKCGSLIGNGYSDVFDAIPYNRVMKKAILADAKFRINDMKSYTTAEELLPNITDNIFINDLIQPDGPGELGEKNIFDIFAEMRNRMPDTQWAELFEGLLIVLWEFGEVMFDHNEVLINKATRTILEAIYSNCKLAKTPFTGSEIEKRKITDIYNNLLRREYGSQNG